MEFIPMKLKHLKNVRDLELRCIREYFETTIENRWEELPKEWKDNLGASSTRHFRPYLDSGLSFVAVEDDEVYGFIFAQMLHHISDVDNMVWIENMGVDPMVRRNEIGYRLLRETLRTGRDMGADVAHSSISADNAPSIMLHKKIGFFMDPRQIALIDLKDDKLRL